MFFLIKQVELIIQNFKQAYKHANTLVHNLRFYFERNNKVRDLVDTTLGFVYKNSKWSDLKNDNIKPTFKLQLKSVANTVLGILVVLFVFVHVYFIVYKIEELPLQVLIQYLRESDYEWCIAPLLILGYTVGRVVSWFSDFFFQLFTKRSPIKTQYKEIEDLVAFTRNDIAKANNLSFFTNYNFKINTNLANNDFILLVHAAEECKFYLGLASMSIDKSNLRINNRNYKFVKNLDLLEQITGEKINIRTMIRAIYLDVQDWGERTSKPRKDFSITKKYKKYIKVPRHFESIFKEKNLFDSRRQSNQVMYTFNQLSNLNLLPTRLITNNILQDLSISKQTKWLYKNNLLSDNLVLKSVGLTNLKKIFGTQKNQESFLKQNLWLTNKSKSNKYFLKLTKPLLDLDNTSSMNKSFNQNVLNFTSTEDSLYWTVKRFKVFEELGRINQYSGLELSDKIININSNKFQVDFNSVFRVFTSVLSSHYLNYSVFEQYDTHNKRSGIGMFHTINSCAYLLTNKSTNQTLKVLGDLTNFSFKNCYSYHYKSLTNYSYFLVKNPQLYAKIINNSNLYSYNSTLLNIADKVLFSSGYNSFFMSYIGNSMFIDKRTLIIFNSIVKKIEGE